MKRRDFFKYGAAVGAAFAGSDEIDAFAQRSSGGSPAAGTAGARGDFAIVNAKILTLEPSQPEAAAALVRRGRIAVVGSNSEVRSRAAGARVFDAGSRVVVPGFIDAHAHFEYTCCWNAYQVDCHTPPLADIHGALEALRVKARQTSPGRWVIGRGGGIPNGFAEKRMPTRAEMDSVSPDHPVILLSFMHVGVLNTRAMKELGLWDAAHVAQMTWPGGKPRVGTVVERDGSGTPGSIATEIWDLLPPYPVDEIKAAIRAHERPQFVSKGYTSVSTMPFSANEWRATQELRWSNELHTRLRVYYNMPQVMPIEGLLASGLKPGFGDDMIRFGGVKVFVSGAGSDGLGHRVNDYKWTQPELNEVVSRLHDADIPVGMHVSGDDEPIERCLIAVEAAQRKNPKPALHHRLEHAAQLAKPEHVRQLVKLGMRATITRAQKASGRAGSPFRTFVREGLEPMVISDTTGSVPRFSPLEGIAALVATPEQGGGARPGENVEFMEALRMWTLWSARGGDEAQDKGSIAVGKLGDFAVLSRDPRQLPASELFDVTVDATILGGDIVFER